MTKNEISDKIADMFRQSRQDAGKSQDWVATKLGVSKKSVQNWESGLSLPNMLITFEWFNAIGVPMYPYFMSVLHPIEIDGITPNTEEEKLRKALDVFIEEMPEHSIRELLYLFFGKHGSNPDGVLELMTAYLKLPLSMKIAIAQMICTNYDICEYSNLLVNQECVKPNKESVEVYTSLAKEAVKNGKNSYLFK